MSDGKSQNPQNVHIHDQCYVNAMSHFYRGELGRIMMWRQRLDVTSNWAITATTTIITVAFTIESLPHIIFFFNICIVWMMLWIEGRRYRFYDAFRARVRMLESHFLVPIILQNEKLLAGEWQKLVCEDLILPSFKISKLEAVGRRLKRNYTFIFVIIFAAWLTKLFMHSEPRIDSVGRFYEALAVTHIPSWIVALIFFGTILVVAGLTVFITFRSVGEVSEFGGNRALWRI